MRSRTELAEQRTNQNIFAGTFKFTVNGLPASTTIEIKRAGISEPGS